MRAVQSPKMPCGNVCFGYAQDVVWTLWGRCVHAMTGEIDILGVFRGDPTARWQVLWTLYKRCGIAVWCDRRLVSQPGELSFSKQQASQEHLLNSKEHTANAIKKARALYNILAKSYSLVCKGLKWKVNTKEKPNKSSVTRPQTGMSIVYGPQNGTHSATQHSVVEYLTCVPSGQGGSGMHITTAHLTIWLFSHLHL